jgi:hypothetical protein
MTRRARRSSEQEVVVACEAFVAGRYVDHLEARRELVPPWAWLNLLAHGGVDDLIAGSQMRVRIASSTQRWRAARAYLAHEVLGALDGCPDALRELQSKVLCPLELDLSRRTVMNCNPPQFVRTVLEAIHDHDVMQRRERDPIDKAPRPEA